jgi:microcystin degradation protein MlrC
MVNGMTFRLGPSVRLQIQGIDVIVQKGLGQGLDDVQGRAHGIIVEEFDVVCIKSSAHWRAFFSTVSDDLLLANSPGLTTTYVDVFEHTNLTYKVYPFDEGAIYPFQA